MTKRIIRREYRKLTPEQIAKHAEIARKVEAEFPPGKPIPADVMADTVTLGEYLDSLRRRPAG